MNKRALVFVGLFNLMLAQPLSASPIIRWGTLALRSDQVPSKMDAFSAARFCASLSERLPSVDELRALSQNPGQLENGLFDTVSELTLWTDASQDERDGGVFAVDMRTGTPVFGARSNMNSVLCVLQ